MLTIPLDILQLVALVVLIWAVLRRSQPPTINVPPMDLSQLERVITQFVGGVKPKPRYGLARILKTVDVDGVQQDVQHGYCEVGSTVYYEALRTPGLKLVLPDGTLEEGKQ